MYKYEYKPESKSKRNLRIILSVIVVLGALVLGQFFARSANVVLVNEPTGRLATIAVLEPLIALGDVNFISQNESTSASEWEISIDVTNQNLYDIEFTEGAFDVLIDDKSVGEFRISSPSSIPAESKSTIIKHTKLQYTKELNGDYIKGAFGAILKVKGRIHFNIPTFGLLSVPFVGSELI